MKDQIAVLEARLAGPDAWNRADEARRLSAELHTLKTRQADLDHLNRKHDDVATLLELFDESQDAELLTEARKEYGRLTELVDKAELQLFLSRKYDDANAIIAIHAGQGGTESCDWAAMLFRMYQRWAEQNDYEFKLLDSLDGEVAGYRSTTCSVKGPFAFGYLRGEQGVHRLVRISPFDAAARRHTSFASVDVWPEMEDTTDVSINPAELRVDTFRASGAGGQHVNKTDSAIRITHIPTGIVVQCQTERSQISNRETAMRMLRARLLELARQKADEERDAQRGEKKQSSFGSQIRSYVLAPYVLVKDHRTGHETSGADKVLDGDLTPFIQSYLLKRDDLE